MVQAIETKTIGGRIIETKVENRNGQDVGIVAGYITTWDVDTGIGARFGRPEQFVKGAFVNSIADHKRRNNRQVRLKDLHGRVIGGFPIDTVREDGTGLFGRGEINLKTQLGSEAWSLAKQGVLVDFSIGFMAVDDKLEETQRTIFEAILLEGSIVDEPMNQMAQFEAKSVRRFADLAIAPKDYVWDEAKALSRIGNLRFSEANGNDAFLCEGKMRPIADVIDGKLVVVPQALQNIVQDMKSNRGTGEDLDPGMVAHLERYFLKMSQPTPFDQSHFIGVEELKAMTSRELERALLETGAFSKGAAKLAVARFEGAPIDTKNATPGGGFDSLLSDIADITKTFKG